MPEEVPRGIVDYFVFDTSTMFRDAGQVGYPPHTFVAADFSRSQSDKARFIECPQQHLETLAVEERYVAEIDVELAIAFFNSLLKTSANLERGRIVNLACKAYGDRIFVSRYRDLESWEFTVCYPPFRYSEPAA